MNCKNCGGELLFRNGIYQCNSCGANFALDSICENIDVCLCYEERDSAGRRTRDSIIAQEIYRKLEEKNIATFLERISADGMYGDELEISKISAIHKARIIIVLGTNVENFNSLEGKYGEHFADKAVIPFCADVSPGSIPKTLSKIQAMSYSTIGWDKDLIRGIYNILGKEQDIDTNSLYGWRKKKISIAYIIAVVLVAVIAITWWLLIKPNNMNDNVDDSIPSTEETTEITEKPLTQKENYDNANELLNQGDLVGALELFLQIPDHPNSANAIKLIYAKYEGYYQDGNTGIYLKINNNTSAIVKLTLKDGETIASFTDETGILSDTMSFEGVDNFHRAIQMEAKLQNDGINLKLIIDGDSDTTSRFFPLSEKSDKPFVQMNKEMFLRWLDNQYTISELRGSGYTINTMISLTNAGDAVVCCIGDIGIEVLLTFIANEDSELALCGISAPAEYIAPELIGEKALPSYNDEVIYWPNACYTFTYLDELFANLDEIISSGLYTEGETISNHSLIGVITKNNNCFATALEQAKATTEVPYYVSIPVGTNAYKQPSYDSEVGQVLPEMKESFRNDQMQTDASGRLWGEIAWVGWICISDILAR